MGSDNTPGNEQPRLGIFWLHGQKQILFNQLAVEIAAEGGFKDYPGSHVEQWREVQRKFPGLKAKEYETIPRGRVTYSVEEDVYRILLPSAEAKKARLAARLVDAFGLCKVRVMVLGDEHYDSPWMAEPDDDA